MRHEARIKALEKILKKQGIYVILDSMGKFWVNGEALNEKSFLTRYKNESLTIKKIGFDLGKL